MDITLVRVDNRLIHGQILEAWVPFTQASSIVVVDDEVAGDFFRETVIRMAVPREVEVIVSGVQEFARDYPYTTGQGKKTIILFSTIADACRAFSAGFKFDKLNLGNVHHDQSEGEKIRCSSCVFLDNNDIQCVVNLMDTAGVRVELQRIPQEEPVDVREIMTGTSCQRCR
jgi:mannose/fructose/N-acetylgalactosamine-specific phosphotransferase system component IIB